MIPIYAERGKPLCIGRRGEENARYVVFDLSHWRAVYGPGTVQLLVQRTGETTPYPAALTEDGSRAIWTITAADTAIPGSMGKAELCYFVNDTLAKSAIWPTIVMDALGEPSDTPPEAQKGWVDQVLKAGAEAQEAAKRAESAAVHQPYPNPETGTWWIWDAEKGEYKDSGIASAAYNLTAMTSTTLGGAMADPAQEGDTQPVRIGKDNKLYTAPGGGGVSGDYIPIPTTAQVGQTIVVKAVDEDGKPTEWEMEATDIDLSKDPDLVIDVTETISPSLSISKIGNVPLDCEKMAVLLEYPGGAAYTPNYIRFNNLIKDSVDGSAAVANANVSRFTDASNAGALLVKAKKINDRTYELEYRHLSQNPGTLTGIANYVYSNIYRNVLEGATSIKELYIYQSATIPAGAKISIWIK